MFEVEVKVEAPHDRLRDRLAALGADHLGRVRQHDTYYDHPVRNFAETDEALRIRRSDGRGVLTYKGPKVDEASKTREEIELPVEAPEAAAALLDSLGFEAAATVEKRRDRYRLDGYLVTLDAVVDLGEYVEVEAEGSAEEIDALRDGAFTVLERLGCDPAESIRRSYLELLTSSADHA